jgi:hypothetical protein
VSRHWHVPVGPQTASTPQTESGHPPIVVHPHVWFMRQVGPGLHADEQFVHAPPPVPHASSAVPATQTPPEQQPLLQTVCVAPPQLVVQVPDCVSQACCAGQLLAMEHEPALSFPDAASGRDALSRAAPDSTSAAAALSGVSASDAPPSGSADAASPASVVNATFGKVHASEAAASASEQATLRIAALRTSTPRTRGRGQG